MRGEHYISCPSRNGGACSCLRMDPNRIMGDWPEPGTCGKLDPLGRPCTLAAGHAHPDDHSGEVRTHPRPIGRISPETEAFVRHLHGYDAEDAPTG